MQLTLHDSGRDPTEPNFDGLQLRRLIRGAFEAVSAEQDQLNRMNVFPVPDGDTGTNLRLTLESATHAPEHAAAGDQAAAVADAALLGGRGNSGVILSQWLAGLAQTLDGEADVEPELLIEALANAAQAARRAVAAPVEGTILTAADHAARSAGDLGSALGHAEVLRAAAAGARAAAEDSPRHLQVLRDAGVVDSGAWGLAVALVGMQQAWVGNGAADVSTPLSAPGSQRSSARPHALGTETPSAPEHPSRRQPSAAKHLADPQLTDSQPPQHDADHVDYGYCTEFLIEGDELDRAGVESALREIGESIIVAGTPRCVHVHIHTHRPGRALEVGCDTGRITRVKIEDMTAQHVAHAADVAARKRSATGDTAGPHGTNAADVLADPGAGAAARQTEPTADAVGSPRAGLATGCVAVSPGPGWSALFDDLGAATVAGGATSNPSTQEILAALHGLDADSAVILPNHPNIVLAAQQAAGLWKGSAQVLATSTPPEGLTALLGFIPTDSVHTNLERMADHQGAVTVLAITHAIRDATLGDHRVQRGDALVMRHKDLLAAAPDAPAALDAALASLNVPPPEIVTWYPGAEADEAETAALVSVVEARWPSAEREVIPTGQEQPIWFVSLE